MENQELLNPGSEKDKANDGVENLKPEQDQDNLLNREDEGEVEDEIEAEAKVEKVENEDEIEVEAEVEDEKDEKVEAKVEDEKVEAEVEAEKDEKVEVEAEAEVEKVEAEVEAEKDEKVEAKVEDEKVEAEVEDEKVEAKVEDEKIEAEVEDDDGVENDTDDDEGESEEDSGDRYSNLSREELVEALEALVKGENIDSIRKQIGQIKLAFRNSLKEESLKSIESEISDGKEASETIGEATVDDVLVERFDRAFTIYREKKSVFDQALERQKQDNLIAKEAILEELRQLIDSEEELKKTYDVFKELQEKWREIGPVPQGGKGTLWNNYHFLVEKFFDKVKINKELRDLDLKKNLEAKTELCEKAEELLLETSVNKSFQKLQKLHDAWKETGPVPKDKKDEIWDRFKAASDALNVRRQEYYDLLREEQNKNLAAKIVLCEQAEELSGFTSDSPRKWQDATNKINELFRVWKTVGFAPKKVNDEVWLRFRSALDAFFKAKKGFFSKYKDEQTENYNQKLNLCMQAEALKDSEDWKRTTDELIALQKEWKKIGPVPRKYSDKVWKRFRTACDEFFHRKSDHFANIGEKHEENLKRKKELIEKIRSYDYGTDNNENLNLLKDFQRQWMEIGHVPIKEKDKIQNEFRKTVDEQFNKLNISRKAKSAAGFRNKIENLKRSPNAENIIYKERNFLMGKISELQNDIKLWENNIGFFASSKKADILKTEFEKKIEKARTDIEILEEKLRILQAS